MWGRAMEPLFYDHFLLPRYPETVAIAPYRNTRGSGFGPWLFHSPKTPVFVKAGTVQHGQQQKDKPDQNQGKYCEGHEHFFFKVGLIFRTYLKNLTVAPYELTDGP